MTTVTKHTYTYHAQRIVLSSPKPLKAVISALHAELNAEKAGMTLMRILATAKTREDLEKGVNGLTEGKRDFLLFAAGSHAQWMQAYYGDERQFPETVVYTIGNPLLAKEILKHDMSAGLDVPPKLLVQEMDNGGTRILYDLPSSILPAGGQPSAEMKTALETLDSKFEMLLSRVLTVGNKL